MHALVLAHEFGGHAFRAYLSMKMSGELGSHTPPELGPKPSQWNTRENMIKEHSPPKSRDVQSQLPSLPARVDSTLSGGARGEFGELLMADVLDGELIWIRDIYPRQWMTHLHVVSFYCHNHTYVLGTNRK